MNLRKQFCLYLKMIKKKKRKPSTYSLYKKLHSNTSFGKLLRLSKKYLDNNPSCRIRLNDLLNKVCKDTSKRITIHSLTDIQQINLIECLNFWGHTVKVTPYCADFGYSYNCNMAIWELKTHDVSARRYKKLSSTIKENICLKNVLSTSYICPPRLLGFNGSNCVIYGRGASKPCHPKNKTWKSMNKKGTNACIGPKTIHFASKYYWQRVRDYVNTFRIFWYWIGLAFQNACGEGGRLRLEDLVSFKTDLSLFQ